MGISPFHFLTFTYIVKDRNHTVYKGGRKMELTHRFFQLDTEWCVVHVPERPNGFGILILGDKNHFVDENTSFWMQNLGRFQTVEYLIRQGYTVFYSNLYGRNWGSPDALFLAKRLYLTVMKSEILNERIHILAEGMGALVALQLMDSITDNIRAAALVNPCIDLKAHIEHEKSYKFFYKSLLRELKKAYKIGDFEAKDTIHKLLPDMKYDSEPPVGIWQSTNSAAFRPELHTRKFEELREELKKPIFVSYHIAEKRYNFGQSVCQFYKRNQGEL